MSATHDPHPVRSPLPDDPAANEKLRDRLREQLETETDGAALQGAELALVALREPLEAGPVAILLRFLAEHLEVAMLRQEAELADLRRQLRERDERLQRLQGWGGEAGGAGE